MDQGKLNDFYRRWNGIDPDALSDGQLSDYAESLREEWRSVQDEIAKRQLQRETRKTTGSQPGV